MSILAFWRIGAEGRYEEGLRGTLLNRKNFARYMVLLAA
jgi:hypothetical protein